MHMGVSENFRTFCHNLYMSETTTDKIAYRYKQITKRINIEYRGTTSETSHSWYVGSYGRDTEIWTSDIDILVQLPYSVYEKYNSYTSNGQSALIQNVKSALQKTYSTSYLKGDGQVVGINFDDKINFEIVPCFINPDGSFTYPDTNDGGTWKTTDPLKEIKAIKERNDATNKNLKRLCRMARAWKNQNDVPMSGILIDTLAYKFIDNWRNKDKSYLYYDFMSRDFFEYLMNIDENTTYWRAPGSNRYVHKKGNFHRKAKNAYNLCIEAIDLESDNLPYSAKKKWREIYGTKFPD